MSSSHSHTPTLPHSHTLILGSGLTGLGCARHLPGARIYEAADHIGGHVYSHETGGVAFDEGAHICHARDPHWREMIFRNAGEVRHFSQSLVRNLWRGHWMTYPVQNHLFELPEQDRKKALDDLLQAQSASRGPSPANYREWCLMQYGQYLTDNFYADYTKKYWRVPMEDLGLDWLKGRLLPSELERIIEGARSRQEEKQSVFSSFDYPARGGFFAFFKPLADGLNITLNARAVRINLRRGEVEFSNGMVEPFGKLVSTIPLTTLVSMIEDAPEPVRIAAGGLRHTQMIGVNMVVDAACPVDAHWFYLYGQDIEASRVKIMSNLVPDAVPGGGLALQCEVYRRGDEAFNMDEIRDRTLADMARIFGFSATAVKAVGTVLVPYAYPVADTGRSERVKTVLEWLEKNRIKSAGLFGQWKFIWSDAAYECGRRAAERVKNGVGAG